MTTPWQLDLFTDRGTAAAATQARPRDPIDATRLTDGALIDALPLASQADAPALAAEAARRNLTNAVPALEALCRRFSGFGLDHEIREQTVALEALTALGGKVAADAVTRLFGTVMGPGRRNLLEAAARLDCAPPPDWVVQALRDDDPAVRAAACRCARGHPDMILGLIDLLADLHRTVVDAAALALGRLGRPEGKAILLRRLAADPDAAAVMALANVSTPDDWVLLGRTALSHPGLAAPILEALDDLDAPRAAAIAAGVRRRLGVPG